MLALFSRLSPTPLVTFLRVGKQWHYHCQLTSRNVSAMAKKKSNVISVPEHHLLLPTPPSSLPIVDTHTHLATTFQFYQRKYKEGKYQDTLEFVRKLYEGRNVEAIVDVWCEPPILNIWKELADSALKVESRADVWGETEYWFAMGQCAPRPLDIATQRCATSRYTSVRPPRIFAPEFLTKAQA